MGVQKAALKLETGESIPCLYNPKDLAISRSVTWNERPSTAIGVPRSSYGGRSPATMNVELFFDTTDTGRSVLEYTKKLHKLVTIDSSLPGSDPKFGKGRPPWVILRWGGMSEFKAVVTSLTVHFTYISSEGVPLRATASMSLKQYEAEDSHPATNPTSGTPHPHRVHRVQPGETLDRIAARYYADATTWRQLALANDIDDPLALRPGRLLAVPEVPA